MNIRVYKDKITARLMGVIAFLSCLILVLIIAGLYYRSRPVLELKPFLELLTSGSWHPLRQEFGFYPFIMGSLWVTGVAIIMAIPLCLLTSIYLSEYAPGYLREWIKPLIDLLAGIPSVIYGVWGVLVIVPLIKDTIAPRVGSFSSGYCVLSGGVVLGIMICPIIIHVSLEVFRAVPRELREASLSLGATRWQTIKQVVLRKARPGIMAAIVLGLSRAFGETMAVLMVVGNVPRAPGSLLDAAYPLPALIANNYGEMLSVPLYDSALMLACFILLLVVLLFNIVARIVLIRIERQM
ncbi:MAG: phosphate ABC transporter permease subunit PstC [Sedimentisphaerales bacterium]|nr:phosphate ABC transporter permease subunit PstC [Sedimentisphaerales bacterium]